MDIELILVLLAGLLLGIGLVGLLAWQLLPKLMIVTHRSPLGFDETVQAVQRGITARGWSSPGTIDLRASMAKHGAGFPHEVKVVQLCNAHYAADVLSSDRWVASLMPCTIAIYEGDDGAVYVSKMNTGLMGRLFGGNIARVMGQRVAADEGHILAGVFGN